MPWANYAQRRLNNQPNLSQAEFAARMASMGNPAGAQSYNDYMASDDYAMGWRPGQPLPPATGGTPNTGWPQNGQPRPRPSDGAGGALADREAAWREKLGGGFTQQPAPGQTPTPTAGNYVVPTQLNGIPNVIPVGASITDGTTTTPPDPGTTPGTDPTRPPTLGQGGLLEWINQLREYWRANPSQNNYGVGGPVSNIDTSGSKIGGGPAPVPSNPWGGPWTNGKAPMPVGSGTGQPLIQQPGASIPSDWARRRMGA